MKMVVIIYVCFISVWIIGLVSWAEGDRVTCNQKLWCSDCITAHKDCAWCKHKDFIGTRCSTKVDLVDLGCDDIVFPNNTALFPQNAILRDGSENYDPIQLTPQHVKLTLRPGKTYLLDVKYRVAANLPIDMYFVMDFTITMKDRINDLADLTQELIDGLRQKFTKNIYIGFGSFLDKVVQPFSITTKQHLENPCVLQADTCEPAYGYIHRQRLNNDIHSFINTISNARTSSNFDPMEGGLDAVLQASVCPDIIGWRNKSRRVLVYISDSGFHFAGDGKLAGIDKPNDGQCHMAVFKNRSEEFIYTHSNIRDYPSYGQMKKVLSDNKINAFFVVDETDKPMYTGLTDMIGTQAATETMDTEGAGSIVNRITTFYQVLSEHLDITAENLPDELDVIAETNCSNERVQSTYDLKRESIKCTKLEIGKEVHINVSIVANECPKDRNTKHTFTIVPSGLQESLVIEVEYICDCECKASQELDNEKCTQGNGTYECGVCKCNAGRNGEFCQCDSDDTSSDLSIQEANCWNNVSMTLCEDRGTCKCGQCICPKDYGGRFCQCDNNRCIAPGDTDKCTNKEQGTCGCGKCTCKSGFYGEFCECFPSEKCLAPENGKICSGNGDCACSGMCECKPGYTGTFCEDCPRCDNCRKCGNDVQKACITCLDGSRSVNATYTTCLDKCSSMEVTMVARFQKDVQPCGTFDADNCQINYIILCENSTVHLHLTQTKQCVNPPDPLLIALPVLGGIIGVGLLLLVIWKILTSFYDKIEYARFEHEVQNPKWSQTDNPIYKTPLTSNQNPVYKGTIDD